MIPSPGHPGWGYYYGAEHSRNRPGGPVSLTEGRKIMGYSQDTICVQGGWQPKNGEPRVLPIYQSTTFKYATSEEMGKLFDLEEEGYFYSRLQNPTNDVVAQKICDLEGGVAAMLTSSGQAATMLAVTNICEAGDHVVCAAKVYGGTSNLLAVTLKRFGIDYPRGPGCAGRGAGKSIPAEHQSCLCRDDFQPGRCCT